MKYWEVKPPQSGEEIGLLELSERSLIRANFLVMSAAAGGGGRRRSAVRDLLETGVQGFRISDADLTHVIMSQRVESLPASLFQGREVQVGEDLTRGARTPLCGQTRH